MTSREAFDQWTVKVELDSHLIHPSWDARQACSAYQKQKDADICDAQNPQPDEFSGEDEYVAQRVTRECREAILDQDL